MNMNWLNTNYILRAGVLSVLLLLPGLISATCKADTIINSYKDDSLRFIIKDDSIITFRTGDSIFTIIRADSVLPVAPKQVKHSRYDNRIHRFRSHWERIIPTHSKIQYAGNMGLLSFGTGWDYGKHNQWETDILLGFIPKYSSKKAKVTMALKQNYMPWSINIGKGFSTPYVWKVQPDESPIDIQELIKFRNTLKMTPAEIRESVRPLSWKTQMQKVIDEAGVSI